VLPSPLPSTVFFLSKYSLYLIDLFALQCKYFYFTKLWRIMNNITHGRITMANVLIVYATDWGSTKKMAEAVASGEAKSPRADLALRI
jgi:hypothetical protein